MMAKRLVKSVMIVGVLWFLSHLIYTAIDGLKDELGHCDVGIILGNKVEKDGTPSERLQSRLDKGAELYNKGYFQTIIVSGGIGKEGFDEAKVMKEYLIKAGIPEEAIIEDGNGTNTAMTAENSKAIMDEHHFQSAMVITQYYHVSRTVLAIHKAGVDTVYSAHVDIFELRDGYSIVREFFGFYTYLVK